jgi:hypothetical protein
LFFNGVDFCPSVSEYRDNLTDPHYLVKPQEGVERRLDGGTNGISVRDNDKPETPTVSFVIWSWIACCWETCPAV